MKIKNLIEELQDQAIWLGRYRKTPNQCDISNNALTSVQMAVQEGVDNAIEEQDEQEFIEYLSNILEDTRAKIAYIIYNPEFTGNNMGLNIKLKELQDKKTIKMEL